MQSKVIKIENIMDSNEFVAKANLVRGDVLLTRGKFAIDGKSALGVAAINVAEGATVTYPDDAVDFAQYLKKFEE